MIINMEQDQLTLEKLEIHKRLSNLEIQTTKMLTHMETSQLLQSESLKSINHILERITKTVYGDNGDIGLDKHVLMLNEEKKARAWHFRTIWACLVTLLINFFWNHIINRPK